MERALWSIAGVSACTALVRERGGGLDGAMISQLPAIAPQAKRISADELEDAVSEIADENLFRPERAMAIEAAEAASVAGTPMPIPNTPVVSRPRLVLRGVLGGPPWDAVIEGIPGHEGAVVIRAGQTLAGVSVRTVRRDTVLARGFDTTWTLTIGRSW